MFLRISALVLVGVLAGCYDVPTPVCGFTCGENDECPSGYACGPDDNRCHPIGQPDEACEEAPDSDRDPRPTVRSTNLLGPITPTLTQINVVFSAVVRGVDSSTIQLVRDDGEPVFFDNIFNDGAGFVSLFFPAFTLVEGRAYTLNIGGSIFDGDGYRLIPYDETFDVVPDAL